MEEKNLKANKNILLNKILKSWLLYYIFFFKKEIIIIINFNYNKKS